MGLRFGVGIILLTAVMFGVGAAYDGGGVVESPGAEAELNETEIAVAAHAAINDARERNGVGTLALDADTQATAMNHTDWMARTQNLNHSARGTYACEYAGENIAYTYADGDVRINETAVVDLNNNETRIAERLVTGWLRSPPHRENLLDPEFRAEGIGIATAEIDGRERVYATQALCG